MEKEKFDFESFQAQAIARLRSGDAVLGKEGILTPLLKQFLEKALEGEIEGVRLQFDVQLDTIFIDVVPKLLPSALSANKPSK